MDDMTRCLNYAKRFLSARMYTAKEIFDKLRRKGYSKEMSENAVSLLIEDGILNDGQYAEFYISDSLTIGYKGIYRVKQELLRKGVANRVIENAIQNCDIDTYEILKEFTDLKLKNTKITCRKDLEKFRTMLARRGYSLDEISGVLSEYDFDFKDQDEY